MKKWVVIFLIFFLSACSPSEVVEVPLPIETSIPPTATSTPTPEPTKTSPPIPSLTKTPYPINTTAPSENSQANEEWPCDSFTWSGTILFNTKSGIKGISNEKAYYDIYNTEDFTTFGGYSNALDALIFSDSSGNVYSVDINGEYLSIIFSMQKNIHLEGLSPDGTKLIFRMRDWSDHKLYLLDLISKDFKSFSKFLTTNFSWNPNSELLLYDDNFASYTSYIKTLNPLDGNISVIQSSTDPDLDLSDPRWSYDGRYIAFRSSTHHNSPQLTIYDIDNDVSQIIPAPSYFSMNAYSWSPTDNTIAFYSRESPEEVSIYILDVENDEKYSLIEGIQTQYMENFLAPVWSINGEYLLFEETLDGLGLNVNLIMLEVDTQKTCRLIGIDWLFYDYIWVNDIGG